MVPGADEPPPAPTEVGASVATAPGLVVEVVLALGATVVPSGPTEVVSVVVDGVVVETAVVGVVAPVAVVAPALTGVIGAVRLGEASVGISAVGGV